MKTKSKSLITFLIVLLLVTLAVPAHAGPPENASGLWVYEPTVVDIKEAGGNTFFYTTEVGIWTGTFEGDSTEVGVVVWHSAGFNSYKGTVSFVGSVDGKSGTLTMLAVGKKPDRQPGTEWEGTWVILGGTGDLANLHGQGVWWGASRNINYTGNVHFDPK